MPVFDEFGEEVKNWQGNTALYSLLLCHDHHHRNHHNHNDHHDHHDQHHDHDHFVKGQKH